MKRIYLLGMILVLVLTVFLTYCAAEENYRNISISGMIQDLQKQPVKNAIVTLKNPLEIDHNTILADNGNFSFSKISVEKDKDVFLEINATGYSVWNNTINSSANATLYINLVPTQGILIWFLLLPAMLGLIAWVSIKLSPKKGKWLSILILCIYTFALSIWILSNRPAEMISLMAAVPAYLKLAVALIVAALLIIYLDLISRMINLLKGQNPEPGGNKSDEKEDKVRQRRNMQRSGVNYFVATATALWMLSLIGLLYGHILYGAFQIAFFQSDLSVPLLVPFFAFLGVLVYSTANIREGADISEDSSVSRKKLIVLGERILIGPYIALVAYLVLLGPILKSINIATSPATAFLAFFTGLYVKQVMDRLDQFGLSMLTMESQEKIKMRKEERDELVDILGLNDSISQVLKDMKITTIDDLASLSEEKIKEKAKNYPSISKDRLHWCYDMARICRKEMQAQRSILMLSSDQIDILRWNQLISIQQLASLNLDALMKLPDLGNDEETLKNLKSRAEAVMKLEDICQQIDTTSNTVQLLKSINIKTFQELDEKIIKNEAVWNVIEKINALTSEKKNALQEKVIDVAPTTSAATDGLDPNLGAQAEETTMGITESIKNTFNEMNIKKYKDIPLQFLVSYNKLPKNETLSNGNTVEVVLRDMAILDVFEYFSR